MLAAFILLLQVAQAVEPYTFREDKGQTTKVILKNGLTVQYLVPDPVLQFIRERHMYETEPEP